MRRAISLFVSLVALAFSLTGPATADFVNMDGNGGDIVNLYANNKDTKVVVKIYAPVAKVHSVEARMKGTDGTIYRAVILNSPVGDKALYKGQGNDINCPNLRINTDEKNGFWKFAIPRGCLDDLTNKIKVKGYYMAMGAPGPSTAGYTVGIRRG